MASVGLIGLGRIGSRLAANWLDGGVKVVGCDIVAKPEFIAAGGEFVHTPADVARAAEIVVLSLVGGAALHQVIEGPGGLLGHCGPRHVVADLSAFPFAEKTWARDRLATAGAAYLDCQITGSPEMLRTRRGVIFASGNEEAAGRCRPIFAKAVQKELYVGAFGAATKLKTANNLMVALNTLATAEAMALVTQAGIDPKVAVEVIGGGAGQSQMFLQRAPHMAAREYPSESSQLSSFDVFLDLIDTALEGSPVNAPLARAAVDLYRRAIAEGHGNHDLSAIYELVLPRAAVKRP